ncbi:MAG: SDR family oxidoreductase [Propionibacteriaceae bacterium]|nr:SDR family oxidoreductase [Propionibacteriaceae bacterium]
MDTEENPAARASGGPTPLDQLAFQNPVTRFDVPPGEGSQPPGSEGAQEVGAQIDCGEFTYRGTGRLTGRKALITGGNSGIGAAVAIAFAREGADVAVNYLPGEDENAQWIKGVIEAAGRKAVLLPGDLSDRRTCEELPQRAVDGLGGIDILVNNAGMQVACDSLEDLSDEQFTATFTLNIIGMYRVTRAALPHLSAGSSIINTTSRQAYTPVISALDYASTKGAINNFTKGLAQQLAPRGIRVNCVAPGPIFTTLTFSGAVPEKDLPTFGHNSPMGRAGQPTEVAPAYVFLASPESSYVVGETLNVNGGFPTP